MNHEFLRWSVVYSQNTVATASIYQKILWFVFDLIHDLCAECFICAAECQVLSYRMCSF